MQIFTSAQSFGEVVPFLSEHVHGQFEASDRSEKAWLVLQGCGGVFAMLVLTFPANVFDSATLPPNVGARFLGYAGGSRREARRRAALGESGVDLLGWRILVGGRSGLGEAPWRVRIFRQDGLREEFEKISARWRKGSRHAVERRVDSRERRRYAPPRGAEVTAGELGDGRERRCFRPAGFRGG